MNKLSYPYITFFLFCLLIFSVTITGCSDNTAKTETQNDNFDTLKDSAKNVWHAASFAMNITNPVYYAKKGATYSYKKYIKHDDLDTE